MPIKKEMYVYWELENIIQNDRIDFYRIINDNGMYNYMPLTSYENITSSKGYFDTQVMYDYIDPDKDLRVVKESCLGFCATYWRNIKGNQTGMRKRKQLFSIGLIISKLNL